MKSHWRPKTHRRAHARWHPHSWRSPALHPRRSSHPWRSTHPWRSSHSRRSSHTRRHAWGSKGRHSHGRAHARRHPHRTTWWHAHWPSHRWSHGPHTRRSPHAHGRWYSIAGVLSQLATHERSSSGIDQGLGLIFHPLLVIELNILFVLSARAVSLSHTWSVVCEVGVTIVTIELWHVVNAVVLL